MSIGNWGKVHDLVEIRDGNRLQCRCQLMWIRYDFSAEKTTVVQGRLRASISEGGNLQWVCHRAIKTDRYIEGRRPADSVVALPAFVCFRHSPPAANHHRRASRVYPTFHKPRF